jgi:hypothetical protein
MSCKQIPKIRPISKYPKNYPSSKAAQRYDMSGEKPSQERVFFGFQQILQEVWRSSYFYEANSNLKVFFGATESRILLT